MSDYVKKKVIRYPITEEFLKDNGCEDTWDLAEKFKEIDSNFGNTNNLPCFDCESTYDDESRYYIDYVLNYEYGACDGDFGISQELTIEQKNKYKEMFKKFIKEIDTDKFRLVKYCYYNGCDCPDYYEVTPPMTDDDKW